MNITHGRLSRLQKGGSLNLSERRINLDLFSNQLLNDLALFR